MDELTVKLSIHHLTKEEADKIFDAAVDICQRTLSASMEVEVYKLLPEKEE